MTAMLDMTQLEHVAETNMQNKFKIIDESGDRKYFTIIPNYIVNHSTPYEQAIYLYMKRIAGESGSCWMSAQLIGKKLGISRSTVSIYRNKLVKRGWIEVVGVRATGLTKQKTPEYRIVDLWELNTRFYVEQGKVSPEITFDKVFLENEKVAAKRQKVSAKRHKEEHIKKNKEEELCSFLKEWNEQQPSPLREFVPENIVRKHGAERVAGLLEEYGQRDKGFSSFLKALVS